MAQGDPEKASPANIQDHLEGLDYPVSKQQLMDHAQSQNAPEDVMNVLQKLDDKEYNSPVDVTKNVGEHE